MLRTNVASVGSGFNTMVHERYRFSHYLKHKVWRAPSAVTRNDANQPVARHFNNGSNCVSDMKIQPSAPFLVAMT